TPERKATEGVEANASYGGMFIRHRPNTPEPPSLFPKENHRRVFLRPRIVRLEHEVGIQPKCLVRGRSRDPLARSAVKRSVIEEWVPFTVPLESAQAPDPHRNQEQS